MQVNMNYFQIKRLQKEYGATELQNLINSGMAWKLEGSVGRAAMEALESGACMLPKVAMRDFYGSYVPARQMVKKGSKGSYQNCVNFWTNIESGGM